MKTWQLVLFAVPFLVTAAVAAPKDFWVSQVPQIEAKFTEALVHFDKKDIPAAKKACDDAYFGLFEKHAANMEVAIRAESAQNAADLEASFGEIRKKISKSESRVAIQSSIKTLVVELTKAAKNLDANGVVPQ